MKNNPIKNLVESYNLMVRAKDAHPELASFHGFTNVDSGIKELEKVLIIAEEAVRPYLCPACEGSGYDENDDYCTICNGTGLKGPIPDHEPEQDPGAAGEADIKFISYDGAYPCLCHGTLTLEINGVIRQDFALTSGGSCGFDENWDECVESGPWIVHVPDDLAQYAAQITKVVNDNVPWGCCGGCI